MGVEAPLTNNERWFRDAIEEGIKKEVETVVKEKVEAAKRELDRKVPEIVSGVAIELAKRITIRNPLGPEMELTVRIEDGRKRNA